LAASKRPSFLKRQKEQARTARAAEKREARRQKKRGGGAVTDESTEPDALLNGDDLQGTDEAIPTGPEDDA
jgi:hypothetical protein